ncbi:short transient receptor potential channel 4 isoform X1, partial [Sigmodon hispidus]
MAQFYYKRNVNAPYRDRIPLRIVRAESELSPSEKAYLNAVEKGDYASVKKSLEEAEIYFKININCIDPLGRTALLIAIENENLELIELLLSFNVYVGDALLHAIRKEVVGAVELLLNHKKPSGEKQVPPILLDKQFSEFTPDITPIILAAHTNNYEIIKLLVQKGVSVPRPHEVRCNCVECVSSSDVDSLRHSRSRLNIYKALASPSLIALSSEDPFLTAFQLSWELQELSKVENEFKSEYEELSRQCKQFAKDLLDQTRSSRELEIILNYRDDNSLIEEQSGNDLARLKLAIKYRQKEKIVEWELKQVVTVHIELSYLSLDHSHLLLTSTTTELFFKKCPRQVFECDILTQISGHSLVLVGSRDARVAEEKPRLGVWQQPCSTLVNAGTLVPWDLSGEGKQHSDMQYKNIHNKILLLDYPEGFSWLAKSLFIPAFSPHSPLPPGMHSLSGLNILTGIYYSYSPLLMISSITEESHKVLEPLRMNSLTVIEKRLKLLNAFIFCCIFLASLSKNQVFTLPSCFYYYSSIVELEVKDEWLRYEKLDDSCVVWELKNNFCRVYDTCSHSWRQGSGGPYHLSLSLCVSVFIFNLSSIYFAKNEDTPGPNARALLPCSAYLHIPAVAMDLILPDVSPQLLSEHHILAHFYQSPPLAKSSSFPSPSRRPLVRYHFFLLLRSIPLCRWYIPRSVAEQAYTPTNNGGVFPLFRILSNEEHFFRVIQGLKLPSFRRSHLFIKCVHSSISAFGRMAIFTMLILPIQEHGRAFHFLISSSISFFNDLKFLSNRSVTSLVIVTPSSSIFSFVYMMDNIYSFSGL